MEQVLKFLNDNAGALTVVFTFFVTLSTVVYAWLTRKLVQETTLLREAATEPSLSVHITPDKRHITVQELVIENHGRGTAVSITWEISPPLESLKQHGVEFGGLELFNGLAQIAPGQQIRSFFGTSIELLRDPICPDVTITARYQSITGKRYASSFILSPAQFQGLMRVDDSLDAKIALSIEKIEKALTSAIAGKRLHVVTVTEEELRETNRERAESIKNVMREKGGTDSS